MLEDVSGNDGEDVIVSRRCKFQVVSHFARTLKSLIETRQDKDWLDDNTLPLRVTPRAAQDRRFCAFLLEPSINLFAIFLHSIQFPIIFHFLPTDVWAVVL